jgi:hypothetical protein
MELNQFGSALSVSAEMKLVISKGIISSQGSYKCTPQVPVPTMLSMKMLSIFIQSIVGTGAWEFFEGNGTPGC